MSQYVSESRWLNNYPVARFSTGPFFGHSCIEVIVVFFFQLHLIYSEKHILITYIVITLLTIQRLILTLLTIRCSILTLLTIRRLILTLLTIRRLIPTLLTIQYNTIQYSTKQYNTILTLSTMLNLHKYKDTLTLHNTITYTITIAIKKTLLTKRKENKHRG